MQVKSFNIYVELDIQAVTCPGVWLCPNGNVILKLSMFGSSTRTAQAAPIFPLLYHQKFIFQKTFSNVRYLTELQQILSKDSLYAELMQYTCGTSVTLATFRTTIYELLYPSPCVKGVIAGVDVDLLMEPTKHFPGILAPKIEVSTKTTIEEFLETSVRRKPGFINPKLLSSKNPPVPRILNQKSVYCNKEQLSKSPKPRRKMKPVLYCNKNCSPRVKICNYDANFSSCACGHHGAENACISSRNYSGGEMLQDQENKTPVWTSASGRVYSPRSFNSVVKESTVESDANQSKRRKKHRECKTYCCSCKNAEVHCQGNCNCSVCYTYRKYFDKLSSPAKCYVQDRSIKCLCHPGRSSWSELSSFLDKCCGCGPEQNSAAAVHQRVSKSLNPGNYYPFIGDCKCPCAKTEKAQRTHCSSCQPREGFYRDLEKYYKKLQKRTKRRASAK